jgi:hypothetical protein
MPSISVILGLMPLIQNAVQTISSFVGDDDQARNDTVISNAFEVITAVAPLIETFTSGGDVTAEDVKEALDGYDQALADFDAEIARQDQQQP